MKYLLIIAIVIGLWNCGHKPKDSQKWDIGGNKVGTISEMTDTTTYDSGLIICPSDETLPVAQGVEEWIQSRGIIPTTKPKKHKAKKRSGDSFCCLEDLGSDTATGTFNSAPGYLADDLAAHTTVTINTAIGGDYPCCSGTSANTRAGYLRGDLADTLSIYTTLVGKFSLIDLERGVYNTVFKDSALTTVQDTSFVFLVDYSTPYLKDKPDIVRFLIEMDLNLTAYPYLRTNVPYRKVCALYLERLMGRYLK